MDKCNYRLHWSQPLFGHKTFWHCCPSQDNPVTLVLFIPTPSLTLNLVPCQWYSGLAWKSYLKGTLKAICWVQSRDFVAQFEFLQWLCVQERTVFQSRSWLLRTSWGLQAIALNQYLMDREHLTMEMLALIIACYFITLIGLQIKVKRILNNLCVWLILVLSDYYMFTPVSSKSPIVIFNVSVIETSLLHFITDYSQLHLKTFYNCYQVLKIASFLIK